MSSPPQDRPSPQFSVGPGTSRSSPRRARPSWSTGKRCSPWHRSRWRGARPPTPSRCSSTGPEPSGPTSDFAGGFNLTSICAVVDGADGVDVLRHLDSLVRKSLVVADHTATRTRYSLFETIRHFAEDRLAETGALERSRDRHAEYFARESAT